MPKMPSNEEKRQRKSGNPRGHRLGENKARSGRLSRDTRRARMMRKIHKLQTQALEELGAGEQWKK